MDANLWALGGFFIQVVGCWTIKDLSEQSQISGSIIFAAAGICMALIGV